MREFEELMSTIWEYSDTYLDSTNKIIRPGKGTKIYWKDICRYTEHTFGIGTATETVQQVGSSLDLNFLTLLAFALVRQLWLASVRLHQAS